LIGEAVPVGRALEMNPEDEHFFLMVEVAAVPFP
jgi:hypothetical protein